MKSIRMTQSTQSAKRNIGLDLIKGFAIIAVILYHAGIAKFGYLGVDVFFVISGYLAVRGLKKAFANDKFSYWKYLNHRLARLWPGLILIAIISLVIGYFVMLPIHYNNSSLKI